MGGIFWNPVHATENLQQGNQYRIIGPVYVRAIYRDIRNTQLNRESAWGILSAVRVSGREVALQRPVQMGTIMTILGSAPKHYVLFEGYPSRYYVQLDTVGLPGGLDVILQLNRGVEGDMDGLNSRLFSRVTLLLPQAEIPSAYPGEDASSAQDSGNLERSGEPSK
jgi:hypothetical protein